MGAGSDAIVRLKLLGASLMAREAGKPTRALRDMERQSGRTGRALGQIRGGRVSGQMSLIQRGSNLAQRGLVGVQRAAVAAGGAISKVAGLAAVGGLSVGLAGVTSNAVSFEQTMANVQARLLTSGANMRRLSDFALQLGAKTQYSAQEAGQAMDELASQGFSVRQIVGVLPGTLSLAAASGADLAQSAAVQTETLHGFGLAAREANRVADVLAQTSNRSAADIYDLQESIKYIAPVARASGQGLETMLGAVGLLSNVGIKGSQAGTTLRTALVRLQAPTKPVINGLKDLGLRARDLYGPKGLKPLPQIIGRMVTGAQHLRTSTRNAALAHIFGREALSGMVALVEKGPAKFRAMSNALRDSRGAAKRAASIMRNTAAGAWDNFTGSVESASIKLTRQFMPALRGVLNAASGTVNSGAGSLGQFIAGVSGAPRPRGRVVAGPARPLPNGAKGPARPVLAPAVVSGARELGERVRGIAKDVAGAVKGVVTQVVDALKPAMPFLSNVVLPLLQGVAEGVLGSIVTAFKVAVPVIKVLATVLGGIGRAAAPLRGVLRGVGVVIGFVFAGPILKGIGAVGRAFEVVGGLVGWFGKALRLAATIARTPLAVLEGVLKGVAGGAKLMGRGVRFVASAIDRGLTWVRRFVGMLDGLPGKVGRTAVNFVGAYVNTIAKLPGKVISLYGKVFKAAWGLGKTIVDGAVKAIKAAPGAITSALLGLVPGPVRGAVSKVLGITGLTGGSLDDQVQGLVQRARQLADGPSSLTPPSPFPRSPRARAGSSSAHVSRLTQPIIVHHVTNLDAKPIHESVTRYERKLQEAR